MTKEHFVENIKDENKSGHLRNYINVVIMPIVYVAYWYFRTENKEGFFLNFLSNHKLFIVIILVMVIYSFWRIFQDNKIMTIDSNLSEEEKHKIIKKILHDLNTDDVTNIANTYRVHYKEGLFSKILLCIYIDNDCFVYNVRTVLPKSEKLIVDRGQALFERKKIADKIKLTF